MSNTRSISRWACLLIALSIAVASDTTVKLPLAMADGQGQFIYEELQNPARTVVKNEQGDWLATFTYGSYTVTLAGPERQFYEDSEKGPISLYSSTWVRILRDSYAFRPYSGTVNEQWLNYWLGKSTPDILALSFQYIDAAPVIFDPASNLKIAGDASYGPLDANGKPIEGSDFNDYLGVDWNYVFLNDKAEAAQLGSLDCSGFIRMVFGFRARLPLQYEPNGGVSLPRHSYQMLNSAPGLVTIPNNGQQVTDFSKLATGDLVFFDASTDDGTQIDHVGLYLGIDDTGHYRFISSRKTADGPTMSNVGGSSTLDGSGLYAKSFRAARRL